jgi:hypothetical protein
LSHAVKKLALPQQIYYRVYAGVTSADRAELKVTEIRWHRAPNLGITVNYEMGGDRCGDRNPKRSRGRCLIARVVDRIDGLMPPGNSVSGLAQCLSLASVPPPLVGFAPIKRVHAAKPSRREATSDSCH